MSRYHPLPIRATLGSQPKARKPGQLSPKGLKARAQAIHHYDGWQTLVHVCHKWRCIVFDSPLRLDLKIYCTLRGSVNSKALDMWPALPIGSEQFVES